MKGGPPVERLGRRQMESSPSSRRTTCRPDDPRRLSDSGSSLSWLLAPSGVVPQRSRAWTMVRSVSYVNSNRRICVPSKLELERYLKRMRYVATRGLLYVLSTFPISPAGILANSVSTILSASLMLPMLSWSFLPSCKAILLARSLNIHLT